jgi:signal transduction histidine kinase
MCCAVATLNDLSTLKALEVERIRAERLNYFEALAAELAHEIANPIAPIKAMTQLLPSRFHDPGFVGDFTRTVSREIVRIEKLVDRLRALSRPILSQPRPTDLRIALRDAVEVMQSSLEMQHVSLRVQIDEAVLLVAGEESELHELFLNLLTNAFEATPRYGSVEVKAWSADAVALVSIRDSGLGIPAAIAGEIFQPFVSSKNRGSGLGLAICEGIAKRHRGSITVANTDSGAEFTVCIPLTSESGAPAGPEDRGIVA